MAVETEAKLTPADKGGEPGAVPASEPTASPPRLQPGCRIFVKGLVSATQLNGKSGKIVSYEEEKGRYAVQFEDGGKKMLLKEVNLVAASADADTLRQIFQSEAATAKYARLMKSGGVGVTHYDDPDLRRLIRRLLEAGHWIEEPLMVASISKSLELAEHPSYSAAIKIIRRLENADDDDLNDMLKEAGTRVKEDAGLAHIFDELRTMGHQFDFD